MKSLYPISILIFLFSLPFTLCAQKMTKIETALNIRHIAHDFSITELSNREWQRADVDERTRFEGLKADPPATPTEIVRQARANANREALRRRLQVKVMGFPCHCAFDSANHEYRLNPHVAQLFDIAAPV